MKLKQDPSHKNFYLPENGNRFFIFSGDTSRAEFNMNEAFSIYGFNFLIVFYQDPELVITENLETVLANKVVNVRAIYWIDRIGTADINSCPNIPFFSRNQVDEYEITFGRDQNVVTARNSTDTVTNSATVLFNEDTSSIDFFVNEGKKDKLITKSNLGEAVQEYHAFTIPLKHQQRLFGKESRVSRNNTGSFCFLSKAKDKPVQPATALLVKKDEDSRSLHSFSYFEDTSYRNNTELLGILYPVMEYDNENEEFQSYIEMFAQEEVATNILDEKGAHYMLPQGSSLVGRLTFISTDKDEPNSKNFFFSPEAGEKLELASGGSFMLLGNSGTERIGKTTLEFERFSKVLISEGAEGKAEFEEYGGVESAVTSIAKVSQETSYFTDSQRAPLFGNTPTGFNVMEAGKREVAYKEVESGKLAAGSELIFIPTLAFKDNDGLEELDKLLIKKRLEYGTKLSGSAYVTPQGFLKNGNAYDFIKKSNGYAGLLGAEEASTSRFNITNVNADFNLSISKEDVFFVLTPEIIENSGVNFDVLFGIQGFTVDLNKDRSTSKGTQRTIIFKYSKHSVDELLKDTARWSNWGKFVRVNTHNMPDWRPVQQGLLRLFDDYERRYDPNGSPNPDYEYIHKSVRMDPNWNGVLILDIPLGEKEVPNTLGGMLLSQNSSPQTPPVNTDPKEKRQFKTGLKFQYVAFPVNKTRIDKSTGIIDIRSTSFYGLIDYDILEDRDDFDIAKKFFTEGEA